MSHEKRRWVATRKAAGLLERAGSRRAAADQAARAGRTVTGRDLLFRLRHGRDPHRAASAGGPGGVHPDPAHDAGHLVRHGAGAAVLPRDRHGVHQARRLVRGGAGEFRTAHRADLRGRAAHRLHRHGGGADRGGHRRGRLVLPLHRPVQARDHGGRGPAHGVRQPARPPGSGPGLRGADLRVLGQPPPRRTTAAGTVFVFVDSFDLATLRYARSMRPTTIRAVHFVIDSVRADKLRDKWTRADRGVPRSAATIVPYDVDSRVRVLQERQAAKAAAVTVDAAEPQVTSDEVDVAAKHSPAVPPPAEESPAKMRGLVREQGVANGQHPFKSHRESAAPAAVTPIGELTGPGRATGEGRIRVVEIKPVERNSVLACEISDGTGELTAMFYGRSHIPGLVCSARVRLRGSAGIRADGHPVMINPAYELLFPAV